MDQNKTKYDLIRSMKGAVKVVYNLSSKVDVVDDFKFAEHGTQTDLERVLKLTSLFVKHDHVDLSNIITFSDLKSVLLSNVA